MSRLIDANANREKFKKIVYQTLNDCTITTKEKFNLIMTAFDNMPTAYDVDKVVAELETLRIDKCNYFGVLNVVAEKYDRANEMLDDAIDIVRNGGVE